MGSTSGDRSRRPPSRFNLPTRSLAGMNRAGALPLIVEPGEVLDDAPRVADRLAADHEHRHHGLARQPLDVVAVRAPPAGAAPRPARSRAAPARAPRARTRTAGSSASCSGGARPRPSPRKIGCRAMSRVAVVTDTTQYLPREVIDRHGADARLALRQLGRAHRPRVRAGRLRAVLRPPAGERGPAEHVAAVGRRLPRRLRAADRGRRGHPLDPPVGRDLGHGARGRAGARRARGARRRRPSASS